MKTLLDPYCLGIEKEIMEMAKEHHLELESVEIIDQTSSKVNSLRKKYAKMLYQSRQRKGMTYEDALN